MKRRKYIAPILITIVVVLYYIAFFAAILYLVDTWLAWLLGIVPILLAGVMIYVCVQRIREIRSGEEDDLSDY